MNQRWQEMRQKVRSIGRPLTCPSCGHRFAYRHHLRAGRGCPQCKIPLGFPFYYRLILAAGGLLAGGYVFVKGYLANGPGWLLIGSPFALLASFLVQALILRMLPPRLEPHAEGNTWIKLT